jgi:acyl-coenzyme A synthetase/AMP-(fatty) acid ligase
VIELMDEHLQPVPAGEPGVLCVRRDTHPGMMLRYWNKPEETDEIFRVARSERSEGRGEASGGVSSGTTPFQGVPPTEWYWSGDVLRRDAAGYFWFEGRADDVIKASGYRISPFEVESCLVSHPAVLEAAAVESPDELRGRVVKAFLVLREGHEPSDALAREIQDYVKQQVAPYKYPRKVEFVQALPKTQSGKIKRGELRAGELGK